MIEFDRVTIRYPNGVSALSDVTLRIDSGEFVFVVGQTGAGKSTLLKALYGDARPTAGSARLDSFDLTSLRRRQVADLRRRVGVVFQDFQLLPDRSIFENVAFALHVTGAPRQRIATRVMAALDRVGLSRRIDSLPSQLSGGEQQRACIARALVTGPSLVIADEPTGNLDPRTSLSILDLFEEIHERGVTVLVATHDCAVVDRGRRRVLTFEQGRLVRDAARSGYGEAVGAA